MGLTLMSGVEILSMTLENSAPSDDGGYVLKLFSRVPERRPVLLRDRSVDSKGKSSKRAN